MNDYPKLRLGLSIEAPDNRGMTTSCISCINFDETGRKQGDGSEQCMKWNMRPPARVIAFGCPDYFDHEEVPF